MAELCLIDRYFLLVYGCNRKDAMHPWIMARCREIDANPWDMLHLYARGHYKSTTITFTGAIQTILQDAEYKIAIFSINNKFAKPYLKQVKNELETNEKLKSWFPDILYQNPEKESPMWNIQEGIVVKREGNPREPSIGAYGVIDSQPTGFHFSHRFYDDVINDLCVTNPDMIEKVAHAVDMSQNLKDMKHMRKCYIGTRYSYSDYYGLLIERGWTASIHPATHDGTIDGFPVMYTNNQWTEVLRDSSTAVIATQQLLNPLAGDKLAFDQDWWRESEVVPRTLNVYILVDPAHSRKTSDRTAMAVLGVDYARNIYALDGMCHRMSLDDRWKALCYLWIKWKRRPGANMMGVYYERYGAQSDVEHYQLEMQKDQKAKKLDTTMNITEVNWTGEANVKSKTDRIQRLEPRFRNGDFYWPLGCKRAAGLQDKQELAMMGLTNAIEEDEAIQHNQMTRLQREYQARGDGDLISKMPIYKNENGVLYNVFAWVKIHEYNVFPIGHPDWLDAASRLYDAGYAGPAVGSDKTFDFAKSEASY